MSAHKSATDPLSASSLTGPALIHDIDTCTVPPGQCAFWWLGQHSFVVKLGNTVIYLDPYLSPDASRRVPPLLRPQEVTNATAIFGTHDHGDHIDRPIWPALAAASPQAVFVVPELLRASLIRDLALPRERVIGVDPRFPAVAAGIQIAAVPAAHELLDPDPATGLYPCLGYILTIDGFTIYHAGDTCIYEGMQALLRQWRIDLAFLPINGRDAQRLAANCIGNMTYQEAVDLAGALRPGMVVPTHFEMFASNSENPQLFADYLHVKYPGLRCLIPVHGQRTIVASDKQ
jgi:L-ascorbate metabolism protein UlaG (beta-lactamase superfamily)